MYPYSCSPSGSDIGQEGRLSWPSSTRQEQLSNCLSIPPSCRLDTQRWNMAKWNHGGLPSQTETARLMMIEAALHSCRSQLLLDIFPYSTESWNESPSPVSNCVLCRIVSSRNLRSIYPTVREARSWESKIILSQVLLANLAHRMLRILLLWSEILISWDWECPSSSVSARTR